MGIADPALAGHTFVAPLVRDGYYPDEPVARLQAALATLCERIEAGRPADLDGLYRLTHAFTEEVNDLQDVFWAAGSEIETVARDAIAVEIELIASTYGHPDADLEEMLAPRDW